MMQKLRNALTLTALLLAPGLVSGPPAKAADVVAGATEVIAGTDVREMRSATGRRYQIFTARPAQPAPPEGYPVVYVLDANIMFGTMVDAARAFTRRPYGKPVLVIGIGYPVDLEAAKERAFDLTPSVTAQPAAGAGTGGAEAFLEFIERELKPDVAAKFAVDRGNETLFGHSYGGLFTLYALLNQPAAFDTFVAASPSIWYENRLLQKTTVRGRLGAKLQATQAVPRVLITAGEFEQKADPELPVMTRDRGSTPEMLAQRAQVDNAREFAAFLAGLPGVKSEFFLFAGEDHGSVIPGAISRAVRFALAPNALRPQPAPRLEPPGVAGGIPVPSSSQYLALDAQQRYDLRLRVRALPEAERKLWTQRFQTSLNAGLTYGQHRRLHEERVAMDETHGTSPPPED
jgi:predicted alpha/beta superfamily hydrolase